MNYYLLTTLSLTLILNIHASKYMSLAESVAVSSKMTIISHVCERRVTYNNLHSPQPLTASISNVFIAFSEDGLPTGCSSHKLHYFLLQR